MTGLAGREVGRGAFGSAVYLGSVVLSLASCAPSASQMSTQEPAVDGPISTDATTDQGAAILFADDAAASDSSVAENVKVILDTTCAGGKESTCHANSLGSLELSLAADFSSIIDVRSSEMPDVFRVTPFDPNGSYLFRKLVCDGGILGSCMPASISHADPAMVSLFLNWIEAGAPIH